MSTFVSTLWLGLIAFACGGLAACGEDEGDTCGGAGCACAPVHANLQEYEADVRRTLTGKFAGSIENGTVAPTVDRVKCEQEGNQFGLQLTFAGNMECFDEGRPDEPISCRSATNAALRLEGTLDAGDGIPRSVMGQVSLSACADGKAIVQHEFELNYDDQPPRETFSLWPERTVSEEIDMITWDRRHSATDEEPIVWEPCVLHVEQHDP